MNRPALARLAGLMVLGLATPGLFLQAQEKPLRPRAQPPPPAVEPGFLTGRPFQIQPSVTSTPPGRAEGDVAATTPARARLYEGLVKVQDGEYADAIPILEQALAEDPALTAGWEALGWSYWHLGRTNECVRTWETLRRLAPQIALPYFLLAQVAVAQKDLESAESLLRAGLALDPKPYEPRVNLALVLAWQAKAEEAETLLRQLLTEEPDRTDVRIELANVCYVLQKYEESAELWKAVTELLPDRPDFLTERARSLLYAGDLEEAERLARRAAEMDGGSLRALNVIAEVTEKSHTPEKAIPVIRDLLAFAEDPYTRGQIRSRLVNLLDRLHEKDPRRFPLTAVIDEARAAVAEDPRFLSMWLHLAELLIKAQRTEEAEPILQKVLEEFNPHHHRALRNLFEIALTRRDFERCEALFEELHNPRTHDYAYRYMDRARLEFAKGNYHDAIAALDRLEEEGMKGAVLGLLYHGLGVSDWEPGMPARLFREHMLALKRAGFQFLTPEEAMAWLDERRNRSLPERPPAFTRFLQRLRYFVTGEAPPADRHQARRDHQPERAVVVTFDDALRTSFRHATPVAEEFNIPLAMHVPVGNIARRDYGIASWEEIRRWKETGVWRFGSHAIDAGLLFPGYEDGYLVPPLANRLWKPEKKRFETHQEWAQRLRSEMQDSRRIILEKLQLDPDRDVRFIAYPYGEIGQEDRTNVKRTDVPAAVLNEAGLVYSQGFVQSIFGYSTVNDNPLLMARYEPDPDETGEEVLAHVLATHPVMMARRMKAELAALQNKPHLAQQMLTLLERDGYPPSEWRALKDQVEQRLSGRLGPARPDREGGKEGRFPVRFSRPWIGIEGELTRANRQIEILQGGFRGGLHLARPLSLEVWANAGRINQDIESNLWFTVRETRSSETTVIVRQPGQPERRETTITYQTEPAQTNRIVRTHREADVQQAGVALGYRFGDGSFLAARLGGKQFDGHEESGTTVIGGLVHAWRPWYALEIVSAYDYDLVPSSLRLIKAHTVSVNGLWRVRDEWEIEGAARYSFYSDTNALLNLRAGSMWLVAERQNVFLGFRYELTTTDEPSDLYWDPYWEQRVLAAARMVRAYPTFYLNGELWAGLVREKGRPMDMEKWRALKARADREGWYPGDPPGSDWSPAVGLSASLRRSLGRHFELETNAGFSFYQDYSEHALGGRLLYLFWPD